MIRTKLSPAPAFSRLMAARARRIAVAHGASRLLARNQDPRRWRIASLLWPHFGKES